ncbi:MAG: hypothetical protein SVU88_01015 [Candidatus Nanohaloarchaea archaeon]|nr:hypothetical protein [Candidatus Nanohaloarchaea archaeon]
MGWHAVENVDDAYESAVDFLTPVEPWTWARLAVVTLFIGGFNMGGLWNLASFPSGTPSTSTGTGSVPTAGATALPDAVTGMAAAAPVTSNIIGLVAVLVGLLVLGFVVASSVFEFVMFRSLREEDVQLRRYFGAELGNGLRYLGFRVAYIASLVAILAGIGGAFALDPVAGAAAAVVGIPAGVLIVLASGLVHDLVLPRMLAEEEGLVAAGRTVWQAVRAAWREVAVYLLARLVLGVAVGIVAGIVVLLTGLALAIIVGIPALLLSEISGVLGVLAGAVGVVAFIAAALLVQVPVKTFMYYYFLHMHDDIVA